MSLFDPSTWLELPGGVAVLRRDLSWPCPCGERRLDVLRRRIENAPDVVKVACPNCIKKAPGEVGVGVIDVDTGKFLAARRAST